MSVKQNQRLYSTSYYKTSLPPSTPTEEFKRSISATVEPTINKVYSIEEVKTAVSDFVDPSEATVKCCPPNRNCFQWHRLPLSAYMVLFNLMLEKFAFVGIQTMFSLYLLNHLNYSKDASTIFYHIANAISYLFTVIAAAIADNGFGRFKTILTFSSVYVVGHVFLPVASVLPKYIFILIIAMTFLSIGSGGIKACLSTFGADQLATSVKGEEWSYVDADDAKLESFFGTIYLIVNLAGVMAILSLPIIKTKVQCNEKFERIQNSSTVGCYPLAFGTASLAYIIGFLVFMCGIKFYVKREPKLPILTKCMRCIMSAFKNYREAKRSRSIASLSSSNQSIKRCDKNNLPEADKNVENVMVNFSHRFDKKKKFLDYAQGEEFTKDFIGDFRKALSISTIFITLPVFWALYEQQASRWLFQADQMDGRLSQDYKYVIQPEQMLVISCVCCVVAIPFTNAILYPMLGKIGLLQKPTSKMILGYFLAALSFAVAGFLQLKIESGLVSGLPTSGNYAQVELFNNFQDCPINYSITSPIESKGLLHANQTVYFDKISADKLEIYTLSVISFREENIINYSYENTTRTLKKDVKTISEKFKAS